MITIKNKDSKELMQGVTKLQSNETFQHGKEIGLDIVCRECSKPFADSLLESGIIINTVVCSGCEKEIAFVISMTDAQIYGENLRGL